MEGKVQKHQQAGRRTHARTNVWAGCLADKEEKKNVSIKNSENEFRSSPELLMDGDVVVVVSVRIYYFHYFSSLDTILNLIF